MTTKLLALLLAAAALTGCGGPPAVPPQTKNAYDWDSPEGKAVMDKSPVPGAPNSQHGAR